MPTKAVTAEAIWWPLISQCWLDQQIPLLVPSSSLTSTAVALAAFLAFRLSSAALAFFHGLLAFSPHLLAAGDGRCAMGAVGFLGFRGLRGWGWGCFGFRCLAFKNCRSLHDGHAWSAWTDLWSWNSTLCFSFCIHLGLHLFHLSKNFCVTQRHSLCTWRWWWRCISFLGLNSGPAAMLMWFGNLPTTLQNPALFVSRLS